MEPRQIWRAKKIHVKKLFFPLKVVIEFVASRKLIKSGCTKLLSSHKFEACHSTFKIRKFRNDDSIMKLLVVDRDKPIIVVVSNFIYVNFVGQSCSTCIILADYSVKCLRRYLFTMYFKDTKIFFSIFY